MTSNVRQRKESYWKERGEGEWVNDVALGGKEEARKRMTRARKEEREKPNGDGFLMHRERVFRQ